MLQRLHNSPGLVRATGLALVIAGIVAVSTYMNLHIDWPVAVTFGVTLGVAMRWPIIMSRSGARVILLTGLLIHALWHHGLPTGLVLLLVEFGVRMVTLSGTGYYWEWYRPILIVMAVLLSEAAALLVTGDLHRILHGSMLVNETALLVLCFVFWCLLNLMWTVLKAGQRGRSRSEEYWIVIQQTWWVPVCYALVSVFILWLHRFGAWAQFAACFVLIWIQSRVGPVFTGLNQDRAVANMVRLLPQSPAQRQMAQKVMLLANQLGRVANLSPGELRMVTYAALLQDQLPESGESVPLWTLEPIKATDRETVRDYVAVTCQRVERDGALSEVANVMRLRYADYDGGGHPALHGETIPLTVQVLTAANATAVLMQAFGFDLSRAVAWLQSNARARFSPSLLAAMSHAFIEPPPAETSPTGLPETVRQLQGLVTEKPKSSTLIGLRRVWMELRGQMPLGPDLPQEVRAAGRIATFFSANTNRDATAQIFVDTVGQLIGGKTALALVDGEGDLSMRFVATSGLSHMELKGHHTVILAGQLSRAILTQEPVQVADLMEMNSGLARELARIEGIRSTLFVPLVARSRTIGVLVVGTQGYHWFTPREVGLIHLLAGQAAIALENARLIAEAEERIDHISNLKMLTDTLLDNLATGILVVDPEGRLIMANEAAHRLFSAEPLEVGQPLPEPVQRAFHPEQSLTGHYGDEVDVSWGSLVLEVQSIPLKDLGNIPLGAICLARDVTRVRSMEEQVRRVEKLAAIGELAAGAAHEIRNPLTAIRGFIQLLHAKAGAVDSDYFKIILSEIDRIDGIIRDLLLLARPTELERRETQLDQLVDEVLLFHESKFARQGITISRELDPVGPVWVDPKMFRQLFLNLVINAAQAMPYGGKLSIAIRAVEEGQVALDVSDTGIGITAENLRRLFVPFFTTKEEGTGLGLALCYSIVQAHNGRIDVSSQVGIGTTFTVTLPIR